MWPITIDDDDDVDDNNDEVAKCRRSELHFAPLKLKFVSLLPTVVEIAPVSGDSLGFLLSSTWVFMLKYPADPE